MEFIAQNMAPIMFASLIIFLLIGYPVAFSLAANGLMFFFIGVLLSPYSGGSINLAWPLLHALPDNFYGSRVMSNDTRLTASKVPKVFVSCSTRMMGSVMVGEA